MFSIEVVVVEESLATPTRHAIATLNGLQQEFRYELSNTEELSRAQLAWRQTYNTTELFDWLTSYRLRNVSARPLVILIVDGPLSSGNMKNLFGQHRASEGLAVFTTNETGRFVHDVVRFIRYYLIRYSLSFVAPTLRSHKYSRHCYFDYKLNKRDILLSLQSGGICDTCRAHLAGQWTPAQKRAIETMAAYVAGDYPHALAMKGGGVKGLAFAGALLELEQHFTFDTFAGTSAGAITAVLLAAGYSPQELEVELKTVDFSSFKDGGLILAPLRALTKRGFYRGDKLKEWLGNRLRAKLASETDVKMMDLPSRGIVYACSATEGLIVFDKAGARSGTSAAFAARCSASIPYLFVPQYVDGVRVYDGGLRENFPLHRFMTENQGKPTIGLFLKSPAGKRLFTITTLIDIVTSGSEVEALRQHGDKIVVIDPSPIRATDFDLTDKEKEFLVIAGRAAAARFLLRQKLQDGPSQGDTEELEAEAERQRREVIRRRRWFG